MSYFEAYAEPSVPEQAALECLTDVPIVVPTPPIDATFLYCLGCEVLNELVTELVLLGSAILPPSRIPERNPMFPYVVLLYVFLCFQLVSTWLLDLSPRHPFHSCHLRSPCT